MSEVKQSFKDMLAIIDEIKSVKETVDSLRQRVIFLKDHSSVGEFVNLSTHEATNTTNYNPLTVSLAELEYIINMEDRVLEMLENISAAEKVEIEFSAGEFLTSKVNIHAERIGNAVYSIDQNSTYQYSDQRLFLILDNLDGYNFVLVPLYNGGLLNKLYYATRTQLEMLFKKTGETYNRSFFKMEFSINGPKSGYHDCLNEIKLYTSKCMDRVKSDYFYDDYNWTQSSFVTNVKYDEIFGITGTAYFSGVLASEYKSIVTYWGSLDTGYKKRRGGNDYDKNKVGFHKQAEDSYKYNSKISYFVPQHYPKDFFDSRGSKDKLFTVLEFKQILLKDTN